MAPVGFAAARLQFTSDFGEAVIGWNQSENALRALLLTLCGSAPATQILTAELGAIGLTNALNSITVTLDPALKEAVESVIKFYNCIREYRNYYVHGIHAVAIADGKGQGLATIASAKAKFAVAQDRVTEQHLKNLTVHTKRLTAAIIAILDTIDPKPGSSANPLLPSHETLPPPDRLQKTLRYPLHEARQPQS